MTPSLPGGVAQAARHIGIFGGTFDPVHNAHLALAQAALATLQLDEVRWIPTAHPWYKTAEPTPAVHREAMLRLAIGDEPRFVLDAIELQAGGPGYTLDTVLALQAAHPGNAWTLVIGQDQYAALHTWHGWRALLGLVTLAVANRPGQALMADPAVQAFGHRTVPLPLLDISASDIRQRAAAGQDLSQLVPPQVARYIAAHRLCQAKDQAPKQATEQRMDRHPAGHGS